MEICSCVRFLYSAIKPEGQQLCHLIQCEKHTLCDDITNKTTQKRVNLSICKFMSVVVSGYDIIIYFYVHRRHNVRQLFHRDK